jgi:hypothetical protein
MTKLTDDDIIRFATEIHRLHNAIIADRDTFMRSYDTYFGAEGNNLSRDNPYGVACAKRTWEEYANMFGLDVNVTNNQQIVEENVNKAAEFPQPQNETERVMRKKGRGVRRQQIKKVRNEKEWQKKYKYAGSQREKVVSARKIFVKTKYGKKVRYIDIHGRYVGSRGRKK